MDEWFDVLDEDGAPTGVARPRDEVHARGLWHRAFHLFLVAELGGMPHALLQIRADDKDTNAGKVDVAVGGHYRAGETLAEVVREVHEEIGLEVTPDALRFLWTQRATHVGRGYVDREHQDVFVLRRDAPPADYAPDPVELAGLIAVSLDALESLLTKRVEVVEASGVSRDASGRFAPASRVLRAIDFIDGDESHLLRAVSAARALF